MELAVKPGELENFQALIGEMVEATLEEPDTLSYERFVTDDGKFVHVYEGYEDSSCYFLGRERGKGGPSLPLHGRKGVVFRLLRGVSRVPRRIAHGTFGGTP